MKSGKKPKQAAKKAYVGPRATILQPESPKAKELADALGLRKSKAAKAKNGS